MTLFKNLKQLLEVKRRTAKDGGANDLVGYQDTNAQGFDRFVVRDWAARCLWFNLLNIYGLIWYDNNIFEN